jgi:hypothetical protein
MQMKGKVESKASAHRASGTAGGVNHVNPRFSSSRSFRLPSFSDLQSNTTIATYNPQTIHFDYFFMPSMATEQPSHDSASSSKDNTLTAICHCGRVRVQLPSKPEYLKECHCTVCYKYGALWAYFQRNDVVVTTASDTELVKYIRADADGDVSFNRCGHCGCMMCWRGEGAYDGPEHKTGVNGRMLPESAIEGIPIKDSKGPGN